MILWTIKPEYVYNEIMETGVYHCDFDKSKFDFCREQYDWLVGEMKKRIGMPPEGVSYPVWAWYMWKGRRKKPDLRRERWSNGGKGDKFVCMEIDIPEERYVLTDFDSWSIILLHGLLSKTQEEDERFEKEYENLPENEKQTYRDKNWEEAFDLTPINNGWTRRGDSIQATFWELRKEDIKNVRFFTSAVSIPPCPIESVK